MSSLRLRLHRLRSFFVLWSAGRGILSITRGINEIYHINETRNYFYIRFISAVYTLWLAVALIVTLGLLVFGNVLYRKVTNSAGAA